MSKTFCKVINYFTSGLDRYVCVCVCVMFDVQDKYRFQFANTMFIAPACFPSRAPLVKDQKTFVERREKHNSKTFLNGHRHRFFQPKT